MGFLSSFIDWLIAFGAGFFGHVIAHDFCEVTPMVSQKIIEAAASRLPPPIRDRYLEEWRRDLQDQTGALAKLKWALGCVISTWKMRREATLDVMRRTSVEVTFENGEAFKANLTTLMVFHTAVCNIMRFASWANLAPKPIRRLAMQWTVKVPAFRNRQWGPVNNAIVARMLEVWISKKTQLTQITKVTTYVDGEVAGSSHLENGQIVDDELDVDDRP